MYESDAPQSNRIEKAAIGGGLCKLPPRHFGVEFQPSNDFEKGMGVAIIVDGVLCTSKEAAASLLAKRLDDLHQQWTGHVAKM